MSYSVADSKSYRPIMDTVIGEHCDFPVDLVFVQDIAERASSRSGDLKGNPVALAVRDGVTGGAGILIRQSIDASRVDSVLSRIEFGGFHRARDILSTPDQFMRHLALHELAHLVNNWGQEREDECDRWAFDRLGAGA